jgi:peptidyl-prolyl cis-trans isomerase A (cyclophilin A)
MVLGVRFDAFGSTRRENMVKRSFGARKWMLVVLGVAAIGCKKAPDVGGTWYFEHGAIQPFSGRSLELGADGTYCEPETFVGCDPSAVRLASQRWSVTAEELVLTTPRDVLATPVGFTIKGFTGERLELVSKDTGREFALVRTVPEWLRKIDARRQQPGDTPPPAAEPAAAAPGAPAPAAAPVGVNEAAMKDPKLAAEVAPDEFRVKFETTKGSFTVAVHKNWSPKGVDRFYNLIKIGYFRDVAFFRAIAGFMAQFGIHGDPAVNTVWREASFDDDAPAGHSNKAYTLVFAKKGSPNSRSVQFFLNFRDNTMLDQAGFTPFAEVVEGKDVVDKINTEYGEGSPSGIGPDQMRVQAEGNAYLKRDFPNLDYITTATIL